MQRDLSGAADRAPGASVPNASALSRVFPRRSLRFPLLCRLCGAQRIEIAAAIRFLASVTTIPVITAFDLLPNSGDPDLLESCPEGLWDI
jgi:hypothetical protein